MGGQFDDLLAYLVASCRVYLIHGFVVFCLFYFCLFWWVSEK